MSSGEGSRHRGRRRLDVNAAVDEVLFPMPYVRRWSCEYVSHILLFSSLPDGKLELKQAPPALKMCTV